MSSPAVIRPKRSLLVRRSLFDFFSLPAFLSGIVACLFIAHISLPIDAPTYKHTQTSFFAPSSNSTHYTLSRSLDVCRYFRPPNNRIDIVYTWVDGSAALFREQLNKLQTSQKKKFPSSHSSSSNSARYRDFQELKYSIRSLFAHFLPHVNNIFIITNGQMPHFLNSSKVYQLAHHTIKLRILSHSELYPPEDLIALPTFNSNSIETVLYRIPNLTNKFLYLNNDFYFNYPVPLSDWIEWESRSEKQICYEKQKVHWSSKKAGKACKTCNQNKKKKSSCAVACLFQSCPQDVADCKIMIAQRNQQQKSAQMIRANQGILPPPLDSPLSESIKYWQVGDENYLNSFDFSPIEPSSAIPIFFHSIDYVNSLYNIELGVHSRRPFFRHMPLLFDKNILLSLYRRFPREIQWTRHAKVRTQQDMQTQFAYLHYAQFIIQNPKAELDGLTDPSRPSLHVPGSELGLPHISSIPLYLHYSTVSYPPTSRFHGQHPISEDIHFGWKGWKNQLSKTVNSTRSSIRPLFVIMQDDWKESTNPTQKDKDFIHYHFERMFPIPSPFEWEQQG
jgi:hypothetical protein